MKTIFTLFFVSFLTVTAFAQTTVIGRVAEVIDGKTVVIRTANFNKLTVKLQFIEVPGDTANDFTPIVKAHLQQLLDGKTLQFQTRRMSGFSMLTGLLLADGVDVSQQMLRDGAAWYDIPEKGNQDAAERDEYLNLEAAAKAEKRGVWGVKDLKPSWEIAAEAKSSQPKTTDEKQTGKTVSPASQATTQRPSAPAN